jgi:hypothetical protein
VGRLPPEVVQGPLVGLFHGHLEQRLVVLHFGRQLAKPLQPVAQAGALLQDGLRLFGLVPEPFPGKDGLDFRQPFLHSLQVKDNLEPCRACWRRPSGLA